MRALLDLFLDICLFRRGPQDVPPSEMLLRLCLAAYGLSYLLLLLIDVDPPTALLLVVVDLLLLIGLAQAALTLNGYRDRLLQTLTALAGTGTLLQMLSLPVTVWLQQEVARDGIPVLPLLLWFALLIWSIAILTHILRQALSAALGLGLLYALGYVLIAWTVADWLHPVN